MDPVPRQPNFAELYERVLVPAQFGPWAQALIERAQPIGPSDRVLDLGCGTGIVARQLRERLGGGARIVGVDKNPDMIAVARPLAPELEWHVANAMQLPFADASFDLVLCQQVLQFVPDRAATLREIHRVLAPGGRVVASTWRQRSEHPLFDALGVIAERHLGPGQDKRFSLGDPDELRVLFGDAGFIHIGISIVARTDHFTAIPARLVVIPGYDLSQLTDADREARLAAIDADVAQALTQFAVPDGFAAEGRASFIAAQT